MLRGGGGEKNFIPSSGFTKIRMSVYILVLCHTNHMNRCVS